MDIPYITTQTYTQSFVANKPSIIFVHTLYKNTNINTKACCKSAYPCKVSYSLKQNTHTHTQRLVAKIFILTCVHNLYNKTNINTNACYRNFQSYMCTCPIQQHKHKHKVLFSKMQVLHVYITFKRKQT